MSKVHAVLLVPEKGDPHELLAWGPCGARPPMAVRRTYPRVVHESNEWGDPTYNGEKCVACDQPWPCETPGKVESEGHVRWQPGNRHTTVADTLVLAWVGSLYRRGWIERLDAGRQRPKAAIEACKSTICGGVEWYTQSTWGTSVSVPASAPSS